jgi:hypothetical protein
MRSVAQARLDAHAVQPMRVQIEIKANHEVRLIYRFDLKLFL